LTAPYNDLARVSHREIHGGNCVMSSIIIIDSCVKNHISVQTRRDISITTAVCCVVLCWLARGVWLAETND